MGATSTSNKDITSFVTFKVKDAEGNDAAGFVVNNGNELNVTAADAGTYTVTAEPNGDNCRIDESVTVQNATFTITKQEITAPVVAISNFAKGQLVSGLTVETATSGLSVSATCFDEDGNQLEEERFKAGTTYSISIVLKADKNHVLNAQTLAVTVNGGDEQIRMPRRSRRIRSTPPTAICSPRSFRPALQPLTAILLRARSHGRISTMQKPRSTMLA